MNWSPRGFADWLRDLRRRFVAFAVETSFREAAAEVASDAIAATRQAGQAAGEALDAADQLADGDPYKARVAALMKEGTVATLELMHQVATGRLDAEEARSALAANPPTGASISSAPPSANGSGAGIERAAMLPPTPATPSSPAESAMPPRRPRGRPRKQPLPPADPAANGTTPDAELENRP